ncbi:unnamed protein product [Sphagnum balticum]
MNWSSVLSVPNLDGSVSSVTYDPVTGLLEITTHYNSDISDLDLGLTFDGTNSPSIFSLLSNVLTTVPMKAANNEALVYYPESAYQLAKIVKYLSLAAGVLAFLFIIAGYFGGRLVGLEASGVIQLAFISLLGMRNMSPTFAALEGLSLCFGINTLHAYDKYQSVEANYRAVKLSINYLDNYNIMAVLVLVPAFVALVCKLLSKR